MKFLVLIALVGLAVAVEELRKDKKEDDKTRGLVWPLPDPHSEGDLMLHGEEVYDRVEQLHKQKVDNDQDKTILAHGRQFLRRVQKYLDETPDFKIIQVLCKDSRNLNGSNNRWELDIQKHEPVDPKVQQKDAPIDAKADKPAEKANDDPHRNETRNETDITLSTIILSTTVKPQDKPQQDKPQQDKPSQDKPLPVEPQDKDKDQYHEKRREFYRQVSQNFVRLLERQWRKEQLSQEENDFVARWNSDEAVHWGTAAIYCNEGENVQNIKKQIATFLEEKP